MARLWANMAHQKDDWRKNKPPGGKRLGKTLFTQAFLASGQTGGPTKANPRPALGGGFGISTGLVLYVRFWRLISTIV